MTAFKRDFREWALSNQGGVCAYCCLPIGPVDYRRGNHLDHFAPKAIGKYPQWSFEPLNLLLACEACNSSLKTTFDPVLTLGNSYVGCSFSIVHPYFDDVVLEVSGTYDGSHVRIGVPQPHSPKGQATIERFMLDDLGYIRCANHRAVEVGIQRTREKLPKVFRNLYDGLLARLTAG